MKQIDNIGIKLCEYQADFFAQSTSHLNCSSLIFVKQFMESAIARRMDQGAFVLEALDIPECFMELSREKRLSQGKEKYPSYVMSWIGYMYRYITYTREVSSEFLFSKVKTRQLYEVYEAYHSLDPEAAAVRILEMAGLSPEDPMGRMDLARRILL